MTRLGSIFRKVAALATAGIVLGAVAPNTEASSVYAFSQQKVYNMTLTAVANPQAVAGNAVNVRTSTAATHYGVGTASNVPAQDATQSFLGNPLGNPGENASAPAPFGVGNTTVLRQADTTPAGPQNAVQQGVPGPLDINIPNYSRSDVLLRVPPPAGGNAPVDARWLFQPGFGVGNDTNLALDSAAEGNITAPSYGSGSGTSNWTVSGSFVLGAQDRMQLMFNLIDRLVVFNDADISFETGVADSNLTFSFDIKDSTGNSVFASVPSYSHLASIVRSPGNPSPTTGITENDNTPNAVNTILGISFVSPILAAGNYTYSINGKTNIDVSLVPEPASYVMMGLGLVAMGGMRFRRKMLAQRASAE